MEGVLGLGAGGHASVLLDLLDLVGGWTVVGLLDPRTELHGTTWNGVEVLGGDDLMAAQREAGIERVFIGLGSTGSTERRRDLYERARAAGFTAVDAIHPGAIVSGRSRYGPGVTVLAAAVVNARAEIGENVIINTAAIVEHDCVVRDHAHVATGARLAGGVVVGSGAHIGIGATVNQGRQIGANAIVGAGAVVTRDVAPGETVVGVPARPMVR
jgi:UDP-perosamine 4-acetyltransferase